EAPTGDGQGNGDNAVTSAPVVPATDTPTVAPVIADTPSPTVEPLAFLPLDESDCAAVSQQQDISGQENLESRTFDIAMDVELSIDMPLSEWQGALIETMKEKFVPRLVGCETTSRRYLKGGRRLQNLRYLIGNVRLEARAATDEEIRM
ncbi:MAG: hypothetical protein SGBAC_008533, partial [Bacillariaceae sp.]